MRYAKSTRNTRRSRRRELAGATLGVAPRPAVAVCVAALQLTPAKIDLKPPRKNRARARASSSDRGLAGQTLAACTRWTAGSRTRIRVANSPLGANPQGPVAGITSAKHANARTPFLACGFLGARSKARPGFAWGDARFRGKAVENSATAETTAFRPERQRRQTQSARLLWRQRGSDYESGESTSERGCAAELIVGCVPAPQLLHALEVRCPLDGGEHRGAFDRFNAVHSVEGTCPGARPELGPGLAGCPGSPMSSVVTASA